MGRSVARHLWVFRISLSCACTLILKDVIRVWPFETGCVLPPRNEGPRVILAEIYPSLVALPGDLGGEVKDPVQIEMIARHLARHDSEDTLEDLFEAPGQLPRRTRRAIVQEEGWTLGVVPLPQRVRAARAYGVDTD